MVVVADTGGLVRGTAGVVGIGELADTGGQAGIEERVVGTEELIVGMEMVLGRLQVPDSLPPLG